MLFPKKAKRRPQPGQIESATQAPQRRELYTGPSQSGMVPDPDLLAAAYRERRRGRRGGRLKLLPVMILAGASCLGWWQVQHDARAAWQWQQVKGYIAQAQFGLAAAALPQILWPASLQRSFAEFRQKAEGLAQQGVQGSLKAVGEKVAPGIPVEVLKNPLAEARRVAELQNQRYSTDPDGGTPMVPANRQAPAPGGATTPAAASDAAVPRTQGNFPYGFRNQQAITAEPDPVLRPLRSGSLDAATR